MSIVTILLLTWAGMLLAFDPGIPEPIMMITNIHHLTIGNGKGDTGNTTLYPDTHYHFGTHLHTSTSFKITLLIGTLSSGEIKGNCTAGREEKHC